MSIKLNYSKSIHKKAVKNLIFFPFQYRGFECCRCGVILRQGLYICTNYIWAGVIGNKPAAFLQSLIIEEEDIKTNINTSTVQE